MRIDFQYGPQALPEPDRRNAAASASSSLAAAWASPAQDEAQFSATHVQVAALAAQAFQLPEIRQERVQPLRQAVHSGRYTSDPQKVAGAIVGHLLSGAALN